MEVKTARRISGSRVKNIVCRYWLEGTCNKNPCRFMHRESPPPQTEQLPRFAPSSNGYRKQPRNLTWKNPKKGPTSSNGDNGDRSNSKRSLTVQETATVSKNGSTSNNVDRSNRKSSLTVQETATVYTERNNGGEAVQKTVSGIEVQSKAFIPVRSESQKSSVQKAQPKQCKYWITGNCVHDKCTDLHSWFCGTGYTMLARLQGHAKAITGISLPSGRDKLYSGGKDGIVQVWDCNNGQSVGSATMDSEVGCLVAEGQWLFAGVQGGVKVWDLQSHTEFFLNGRAGLVCSIVMNDEYDKLFAGMEDGTILVWKLHPKTKNFEPAAMMKEHNGAVRSLVVGAADKLYSSSTDCTIKVWELQNFQCLQTLHGHTKDVTSVLCWDRFLLSASLDNTLKVWAATESGTIEMVHEIKENYGVNALCGINDAEAKPILLSSFSDNTVRLYDLPSFTERGRIFSKSKVNTIQIGVGGLFFTGDATGEVFVWKLLGDPCATAS